MKEEIYKLLQKESKGSELLILTIRGSKAYGTDIETSDTDYSGVYIQSIDDILGYGYKEQISDKKNDIVLYEIKRLLELLGESKTNVIEQLNTPEDLIVYKHPLFDEIIENKDKFVTKKCYDAFFHYAKTQKHKARGLDKKINWENEKKTKMDIMDFCYVIDGSKSYQLKDKLKELKIEQQYCGLVNVPNAMGVYALYWDQAQQYCFSESNKYYREESLKYYGPDHEFLGYKGIVSMGDNESNQLRLSSIPKGEECVFNFHYNKDGYIKHCKEYKSYTDWLAKRNTDRYVDTGDGIIDAKNMMHCRRLVDMSREIAMGKGVCVKRPNRDELLEIRFGKVNLEKLIDIVDKDFEEIESLYKSSNLEDEIEEGLVEKLLINIRKKFYNI